MQLNLPYIKRNWRRLLAGKVTDFRDLAATESILCARETVRPSPAIYPEGALEKITQLSPWRSWDAERAHWEGAEITHHETIAYEVDNVDLVQSYLYCGADKKRIGMDKQKIILPGAINPIELEQATMVSSWAGCQFFGTLLMDDFPLELIDQTNPNKISIRRYQTQHELEYRQLLDLQGAPQIDMARIDKLILYLDFSQNSFKAQRYQSLRARMRANVSNPTPAQGVYIRRGASGEPRQLENESEIEALLTSHGFVIVDPATMSAHEIAAKALDAKIVVGTEGSQLSHGIFSAADDAAFLVFQPPWRFSMSYKEFADCLSMPFAFLVGETSNNQPKHSGYTIDPGELQDMVLRLS